jgi:hypothetical protein
VRVAPRLAVGTIANGFGGEFGQFQVAPVLRESPQVLTVPAQRPRLDVGLFEFEELTDQLLHRAGFHPGDRRDGFFHGTGHQLLECLPRAGLVAGVTHAKWDLFAANCREPHTFSCSIPRLRLPCHDTPSGGNTVPRG